MGKVDCDDQSSVAQRFQISKYPTLKLVVNGVIAKREFRGQRSKESFVKFIRSQLTSPVIEHTKLDDLKKGIEKSKGSVIAYFKDKDSVEFNQFENIAKQLRDECKFFLAIGDEFAEQLKFGNNIVFKPQHKNIGESDEAYSADLSNSAVFKNWIEQKCIPFIREITFNNAEELTEEGLMFLILFHKPEDEKSLEEFTKAAERELRNYRGIINILRADGNQFQHPLHHLGKSLNDLPLIAIDSFRHMYLFPKFEDIHTPRKLTTFIDDLKSGKLHREFHNGPDEVTQPPTIDHNGAVIQNVITSPPKSVFKNLQPSNKRYTVLDDKDEL
ncbi:Endoplasmic reticulum resident protein 44 [Nymphon striatum]|nr:Endoplasmic reticulum resident protein 44 [Nymphon striatum]